MTDSENETKKELPEEPITEPEMVESKPEEEVAPTEEAAPAAETKTEEPVQEAEVQKEPAIEEPKDPLDALAVEPSPEETPEPTPEQASLPAPEEAKQPEPVVIPEPVLEQLPEEPLPSGAYFRFNKARSEGLRHIRENIPCQDAVATLARKRGQSVTHAIALSDGCSSSALSHFGSQITVNTVVSVLCEEFDRLKMLPDRVIIPFLVESIIKAQKKFIAENRALFEHQREIQGDYDAFVQRYGDRIPPESNEDLETLYFLRMMNATVLFVAERLGQTIYGHLGDGYILRLSRDNKMTIASMEDKTGEHNVTNYPQSVYFRYVVTGNILAYRQMKIYRTKELSSAWILISDGPENTLVQKRGPELTVRPYVFNLMVRCTMLEENPEAAHKVLQEFFDGKLRDSTAIHGGDDISTAIMVHDDCMDTCKDPANHPIEYVTTIIETHAEEEEEAAESAKQNITPTKRDRHSPEFLAKMKDIIYAAFQEDGKLTPSDIMETLNEDRDNQLNPLEIDNILSLLIAEGKIRRLEAVDELSGTYAYEIVGAPDEDEEEEEDE